MFNARISGARLGILALLLFAELGCRGGRAMLHVDQGANNTEVVMTLKQELEISLPENPTTGFRWELKTDGQPACALSSETFDAPPGGVGKSGVRRWRFESVTTGTANIELIYRRPWEDKAPAQTFQLTARVTD